MRVVPAIDILDGSVVRVKQGKEETAKSYSDDPLEVATRFEEGGAKLVHVVDLNAALHNDPKTNSKIIIKLLSEFRLSSLGIEIAGGIRSRDVARKLLSSGAKRIVLSSVAYTDLNTALRILREGGKDRVVLALDYDSGMKVRTSGWKRAEAETVDSALARFYRLGFASFLLTSIKQDGMMEGPDLRTLSRLRRAFPGGEKGARLIASGGISSSSDLRKLDSIGIDEAIVGKALYEGKVEFSVFRQFE